MTVAPDIVVDPAQVAFEQASRDPLEVLTETERSEAERLIQDGNSATTAAQAALVVAGSFLLYREFMRRRLARSVTPSITRVSLGIASDYYWRQFFPTWVLISGGALEGAARGGIDASTGEVPDEILQALAEDYAERLGPYLHESSKQALVEGFSQHVNKRLPRKMAADRAIASLGLSQRQMRALNASKTPPPVNSVLDIDPDVKQQQRIDQALVMRAKGIGEQETYSVSQEARQLGWMFQISKGRLSANAERMWVTARDERVCKTCGPMHKKIAKITEPFDTPYGPMWAPSMHPNCRCEMKLRRTVDRELVKKNLFGSDLFEFNEEHPRGHDGQFRTKTKEQTTPKVAGPAQVTKPAQVPQVTRVAQVARVEQIKQVPQATGQPVQVAQVTPVQMEQVAPEQVIAAVASIPQIKAHVEMVRATKTEPVVDTKKKLRLSHAFAIKPVYLAAADTEFHGSEHQVQFVGNQFAGYDSALTRAKAQADEIVKTEAARIVSAGKNQLPVGDPEVGRTTPVEFTQREVEAFLQAELFGWVESPARRFAQGMGFHREDHPIDIFKVSNVRPDEFDGDVHAFRNDDAWEISGDYDVDHRAHTNDLGLPIRIIELNVVRPPDEEYEV